VECNALRTSPPPPRRPSRSWVGVMQVALRFYPMDLELLFSTSPFVTSSGSGAAGTSFSHLRPNSMVIVPLGAEAETRVSMPAEYRASNVMVEAVAGAVRCQQVSSP
jgi:hypothetical protein